MTFTLPQMSFKTFKHPKTQTWLFLFYTSLLLLFYCLYTFSYSGWFSMCLITAGSRKKKRRQKRLWWKSLSAHLPSPCTSLIRALLPPHACHQPSPISTLVTPSAPGCCALQTGSNGKATQGILSSAQTHSWSRLPAMMLQSECVCVGLNLFILQHFVTVRCSSSLRVWTFKFDPEFFSC